MFSGSPPGPRYERRSTGGAPPVVYLCHAVAPRRSSYAASLNSSSACVCHLDVAALRRFTPAAGWGGGGGGQPVGVHTPSAAASVHHPVRPESPIRRAVSLHTGKLAA